MSADEGVHLCVVANQASAEIGFDGPRCYGVDGDSAFAEFFGEIAAKDFNGAFHGGVGGVARQGKAGQAAGKIDDAAAVGEQWQKRLRDEESAL